MPIYEYACSTCGHQFEKRVKLNAAPPPCPACEGEEVKKLISRSSSFVLKGQGWYRDHYGLKGGGSSSNGGES